MTQALQTRLRLLFTRTGKNVTESLMPDLLSFSYDDKETNESDEVSLTLMRKSNAGLKKAPKI